MDNRRIDADKQMNYADVKAHKKNTQKRVHPATPTYIHKRGLAFQ